jgi:alkylation response protein AidB-like acyl-CoA dehydrogenase
MSSLTGHTFDSPRDYEIALSAFLIEDPRLRDFRHYRAPTLEAGATHLKGLQRLLFKEGWSRLGWPERSGGLGGDPRFRGAMFETLWRFDIPIPESYATLETLAPVILVHAPHLADALLPRLLRGDESWTQAFSEPDAGSDLASLRTRMERDGVGWRITGQKAWATYGHLAQRAILLARSDGSGHRGLTMVLLDLDQPGVETRPTRAENGENHFSEIFLENAFLPHERIIGQQGEGWTVAMYMLQWERGAWGWLQQGRFHSRLNFALKSKRDDPAAAAALGRAYAMTTALRLQTRATVDRLAHQDTLGADVSIDKLLLVDAELAVWNSIRDHIGLALDTDPELEWLRREFLFSRAAPIYGGSQDIQRTIVAQRVLGMPRGS